MVEVPTGSGFIHQENFPMSLPVVALVGRPNTGKSTLFNRFVGGRRAVVSDQAKTTRDRNYGEIVWNDRRFLLVDTGGLMPERETDAMDRLVVRQVQAATAEADLVLFLVDAKTGAVTTDVELARDIRKRNGDSILVANKIDSAGADPELYRLLELGLGEAFPVSAAHGTGVGDLLDEVVRRIPEKGRADAEEEGLRIGIVGRPNVGKSSLVNAYLGREQMIVSEIPGTTRDSIDSAIRWRERRIVLVDTAGLRRRSRVHDDVEYYSTLRAVRAIERSHVVFLLLDASEPIGHQDAHIASMAEKLGRGIVLLLNKTDLELDQSTEELKARVLYKMPFLSFAPVLAVSATTRKSIGKALDTALAVDEEMNRTIPTAQLNKLVEAAVARNAPPVGRRPNQVYYAVQTGTRPPTFLFFVKEAGAITPAYRRYIIRSIREKYPFRGAPVVVHIREKKSR
ncbi:MAG: ribosome biogenesis GTPase Der [Candidatus Eisenbacteria bacterium]